MKKIMFTFAALLLIMACGKGNRPTEPGDGPGKLITNAQMEIFITGVFDPISE